MTSILNSFRCAAFVALGATLLVAYAASISSAAQESSPESIQPLPPNVRLRLDAMLAVYDQIHAKLAADQITAAQGDAERLEAAAVAAEREAPQRLRSELTDIATSAARLNKVSENDSDEVRVAFGEVSRSVVALLAVESPLREGRHAFSCPMAQGYQKWVQESAKISNPYMGERMQACGSQAEWME